MLTKIGAYQFAALVSTGNDLICELEVILLRRAPPGAVVKDGGDLDKRLKTLLDALRIPDRGQIPKAWQQDEDESPMMCLLSDDKLVTSLTITADRLLEPATGPHPELDVDLMIKVRVRASEATVDNIGLTG